MTDEFTPQEALAGLDSLQKRVAFEREVSSTPLGQQSYELRQRAHALREKGDMERAIAWAAAKEPTRFPLNVALAARERIPLSPGDHRPGERQLLAYYQGRIAWEELFPEEENGSGRTSPQEKTVDPGTGVDTSKIQSYQIREFVEALKGIRDDLRECVVSEPAMRLSLLGPVSPVALVREIMRMIRMNARSPIAGAFQLVELLACLGEALRWEVDPKLQEPWGRALAEARGEIERALDELRSAHPELLKHAQFRKYEKAVRGQYDVGGHR